jgi:hypothetical protein
MRFTPRFGALLIALTVIGVSRTRGQEGEPIPQNELPRFLGPVPADQVTWRVVEGPDFTVYYGKANPPLAGSLGFYVGGWPQKMEPGQSTFRSRLGRFPVEWHRWVSDDGSISQQAIIRIDNWFKADVWAEAPNQTEMDKLLAVLGRLPTFANGILPDRYRELQAELVQEDRIGWLIWICWSAAVLAAAWLVDRALWRRKFSPAGRLLAFAATALAAIAVTFGGIALLATLPGNPDQFAVNLGISWYHKAHGFLLFTAAAALAGLALLLALGLMLARQLRAVSRRKSLAVR